MTPCPVCGKPVDPLRAPAVSVRDGKVVPFCSREHKEQADTQPVRIQPTKVVRLPSHGEGFDKIMTPSTTASPSSGVPTAKKVDLDSGPVIEIIREPSVPVGKVETPRRKRSDSQAVQIADTGHIDDYITGDEPRRRPGVVVFVLLLLVAGGVVAYSMGYFDKALGRGKAEAPPPLVARDAAVAPVVTIDAVPAITPAFALDKAKAVLASQLKSDSPRVQRVAASALARTGDKAALDRLAAQLGTESSDLGKVEIGYVLARGGDKRGLDALSAALNGPKRDPKLEAARRFCWLGDKRAVGVLENYLEVSQLRLGTAEQLAFLAEPRALKVLDSVVADPAAVPDEKARATIALGQAGRTDVAPALRALLSDDRQNSFAAQALAGLHDEAARKVLVAQLAIPSLRVKSARALRRLAPDADIGALLPPLVAALDSNKDTEQVQIAEAILLLAGPAAWSEHE